MQKSSSGSARVIFPRHDLPSLTAELRSRLPTLRNALPLRRVILFGSWATGRATATSDIDLLVVYDDPPQEDAYKVVRRTIAMSGLEPHVYTVAEARAVADVLDRMVEHGIELLG